jgi:hypothetical protein
VTTPNQLFTGASATHTMITTPIGAPHGARSAKTSTDASSGARSAKTSTDASSEARSVTTTSTPVSTSTAFNALLIPFRAVPFTTHNIALPRQAPETDKLAKVLALQAKSLKLIARQSRTTANSSASSTASHTPQQTSKSGKVEMLLAAQSKTQPITPRASLAHMTPEQLKEHRRLQKAASRNRMSEEQQKIVIERDVLARRVKRDE